MNQLAGLEVFSMARTKSGTLRPKTWVRLVRDASGLKQEPFGVRVGAIRELVGKWETEGVKPGFDYVQAIRREFPSESAAADAATGVSTSTPLTQAAGRARPVTATVVSVQPPESRTTPEPVSAGSVTPPGHDAEAGMDPAERRMMAVFRRLSPDQRRAVYDFAGDQLADQDDESPSMPGAATPDLARRQG